MWEIRYFIPSTPQSNEFWGMQTLYMSRNPLRRCVFHNCGLVFCSPGGRWGIRQGAGHRKGTHCLLTVFKTSQLHSTLQWNLVSETSALLCEMTFLVRSQPEKTVSEVISSASAREWSGKGKKKSITAWQLVLTLSGMGWWVKANWSKVKHFFVFVCVCFFFLNDSSWQRPSAEKSTEPASPQKNGPSSYKRFRNICLSPGTSPVSLPSKPHSCWMDISDYKYNR